MGRAIVREPQVFLMDEPLSNLDAKLRVQTRAQIAALQQRLGVTTVYVTHDQVEAMTMGDRVAVLLDGILQQVDGPRALYDRPANAFVAGFIGSPAMNLRTVRLTDSGADFGGMAIPLTREQIAAARADGGGNRVTIGFRPEHSELVSDGDGRRPDGGRAGRGARLRRVRARPRQAQRRRTRKDTLVVRTDGRVMPRIGEMVYVRPREGSHHVFHAETGIRL